MTAENLRTVLYDTHVSLGGRMVPFGGWDMPVQYPGGILAEVKAVRTASGVFDVSHMGRLYISGPKSPEFLDWVLTGSSSTLRVGRARYCMICNEKGGVIDDTIFYRLAEERYLLIPNAGNRSVVVAWFQRWIDEKFSPGCTMEDVTGTTGLIAFQGPSTPKTLDKLADTTPSEMRPFSWANTGIRGAPAMVARTGYTGEDGFEILVQGNDVVKVWTALTQEGAVLADWGPETFCAWRRRCLSTVTRSMRKPPLSRLGSTVSCASTKSTSALMSCATSRKMASNGSWWDSPCRDVAHLEPGTACCTKANPSAQ